MKRPIIRIFLVVLCTLVGYAGWLGWRAHKKLVTLHVHEAPIAKVMSSLRWQTWENFVWNKDLKGAITLDVDNMPLEQVLGILSEQLEARWTTFYPIYLRPSSVDALQRAVRGEIKFSESHFTNSQSGPFGMRDPGDGAGPHLVTLQLADKPLAVGTVALERFAQARVLPENGWNPNLNLTLSAVPFEKAVAKMASAARRSWTKFYALEANRRFGGSGLARGGAPGSNRGADVNPDREAARRERMQQVLDTLPPEERQRAEERQQERQAIQSLPPEQRQQVMAERMNSPEMQQRAEQRMASGIKNTTPEQRRDRYEKMFQMRKARAAGQVPSRNG